MSGRGAGIVSHDALTAALAVWFDLVPWLAYLPAGLPVRLQQGRLDSTLQLQFAMPPQGTPTVANFFVQHEGPLGVLGSNNLVSKKYSDLKNDKTLRFDFTGSPASRTFTRAANSTKTRDTVVADAGTYVGVIPLTQAAAVGVRPSGSARRRRTACRTLLRYCAVAFS